MREITAKKVQDLMEEGEELHLIDVRENDEVAAGKIPGAVHIPLGEVPSRINELDQSNEYILICRSGGRSGRAAAFLESKGYQTINMKDGMLGWEGNIA